MFLPWTDHSPIRGLPLCRGLGDDESAATRWVSASTCWLRLANWREISVLVISLRGASGLGREVDSSPIASDAVGTLEFETGGMIVDGEGDTSCS